MEEELRVNETQQRKATATVRPTDNGRADARRDSRGMLQAARQHMIDAKGTPTPYRPTADRGCAGCTPHWHCALRHPHNRVSSPPPRPPRIRRAAMPLHGCRLPLVVCHLQPPPLSRAPTEWPTHPLTRLSLTYEPTPSSSLLSLHKSSPVARPPAASTSDINLHLPPTHSAVPSTKDRT